MAGWGVRSSHVSLLLLVVLGCGDDPPYAQVDVTLSSDPGLLSTATQVRLRVLRGRNGEVVRDTSGFFAEGFTLPQTATVIPFANDPAREFSVLAELMSGTDVLATQRLISDFVPGRKVSVTLRFTDGCGGSCGPTETCVGAACTDACYEAAEGRLVRGPCGVSSDAGIDAASDALSDSGIDGADSFAFDGGVDGGTDGGDAGPEPIHCEGRLGAPWHACFEEVVLGAGYTCATEFFGGAYRVGCWGTSAAGAMGSTERYDVADGGPSFDSMGGLTAGQDVTCFLDLFGSPTCIGKLPYAEDPPPTSVTPVGIELPDAPTPRTFSVRDHEICGVQDGELVCLGPGGVRNNLVEWDYVRLGVNHSCGVAGSGTQLLCWGGENGNGQLFFSGEADDPRLVDLEGELFSFPSGTFAGQVHDLSVGYHHTCVILENDGVRTLYCAGLNFNGELGGNFGGGSGIVVAGTGYLQVSAGNGYTCAVTEDERIECWGLNSSGQLGNGYATPGRNFNHHSIDRPREHGGAWKRVMASDTHTCALTVDHTLYCWGSNAGGQLSTEASFAAASGAGPFPIPSVVLRQRPR